MSVTQETGFFSKARFVVLCIQFVMGQQSASSRPVFYFYVQPSDPLWRSFI